MEIRRVSMSAPMNWVKLGWQNFAFKPGTWIVIALMQIVLSLASEIHPLFQFVYLITVPFFTAGMYHCAELAKQRQPFNTDNFFSIFKRKDKYSVLFRLVALQIGISLLVGIMIAPILPTADSVQTIEPMQLFLVLTALVTVAAILALLFFFIVPLVLFNDDIDLITAMKMSFTACWRNLWPMTVYGLLAFGVILLGIITLGFGLLVAMPLLLNAQYYAYLEIFEKPQSIELEAEESEVQSSAQQDTFEA